MPENAIRAAYAASLGISYLPEGTKSIIKEYLADMDYISVREKSAKALLSDLTGKEINVNIDPVFLLNKDEWKHLGTKTKIRKPYIMCYVLYRPGWLNNWLKRLHKNTGLDIVVVSTEAYRNIYHNDMVRDAGPKEFLGLIQNAEFVVSSSFHGVALSVANQKPFYAVVNPDMPSRISDLLSTLGLEDRIITDKSEAQTKDIDYAEAERRIETEREKSFKYLTHLIHDAKKHINREEKNNNFCKDNISIIGDKCTACKVCEKVCLVKAVFFKTDNEGFSYPYVDENKCIKCGVCIKTCHVNEHQKNSKEHSTAYYG